MAAQSQDALDKLVWPADRLGEVMALLAHKAGLIPQPADSLPPLPDHARADDAALERWVELAAGRLGVEAEPFEASLADLDKALRCAAPAILRLPAPPDAPPEPPRFLALLAGGWRLVLLGPDLKTRRIRPERLRDALSLPIVRPWVDVSERMLAEAGIPPARRQRARLALVYQQMSSARVSSGWLLRLSPGASLWQHAAHARLWRRALTLGCASLAQQSLVLLAWWLVGRSALSGEFEWAWLWAWALLLFTAIPFQLLTAWSSNMFATGMGGLFKQRLLYGALKLQPDEIRHQGMGQFLGRVMESEAVELLALGGGVVAVISLIQLGMAGWVLAHGAGGWMHVGLLAVWLGLFLFLGWLDYRRGRAWVKTFRYMTNDLVERMVGHRTRLAQEDPRHWHLQEDQNLDSYLNLSKQVDQVETWLAALPNAWLVAGLGGLALAFAAAQISSTALAISLGGVLLAYQALISMRVGEQSLVQLTLAWDQVAPLFQAAARPMDVQAMFLSTDAPALQDQPVLSAQGLSFRYRERARQVLQDCSLKIYRGERLLLEGPSGGGKTTLAAVLSGLRAPESGLLLLRGLDRSSLGGDVWRRHVAVAPQFHENHVFTETFGFNLLMGRRWPPTWADLEEAEAICDELGLGELLRRMPSGWQQMVGESGWQLSHGERSRVYIARALLQKADLMIMDESFGALDPENLDRALRCALNRAPTLLVIAHP